MNKFSALLIVSLLQMSPLLAQDIRDGEQIFMDLCATCHGIEGTGHGPMAAILTLQPTDLTQLAAREDGVFPTARVVGRIDGRDPLVSHGSPMPVFGDYFEGKDTALKTSSGQPIMTSQPIVDLVEWLQALQSN